MNVTTILLFVLLILGEIACIYVAAHTKAIAKNNAEILQNRKKEYEAEKGKNMATKEDIEEITKKVEEMKTAVSLSKQNEYDVKLAQERILLGILEDATKVSICYIRMHVYLNDISSRVRLDSLVENVHDILLHFRFLCNQALISIHVDGIDGVIENLVNAVIDDCGQVSVTATEAAILIDKYNDSLGFVKNPALSEEHRKIWIKSLSESKEQIEEIKKRPVTEQEILLSAIRDYSHFLKELYGKDLFLIKIN